MHLCVKFYIRKQQNQEDFLNFEYFVCKVDSINTRATS